MSNISCAWPFWSHNRTLAPIGQRCSCWSPLSSRRSRCQRVHPIRLGRITALEKPSGGIRGIVVGDFNRRLVARTIAQQVSEDVQKATKPFQFALSTRAGCECVSHVLQTLLEMDENTTLLSMDGVQKAMMEGLLQRGQASSVRSPPTVPHPFSCGRTRWGLSTSSQGEGENKATR